MYRGSQEQKELSLFVVLYALIRYKGGGGRGSGPPGSETVNQTSPPLPT